MRSDNRMERRRKAKARKLARRAARQAHDARLLRAAPALLLALKDLLEFAKAISSPGDNVEKRQARRAIAAAERGEA